MDVTVGPYIKKAERWLKNWHFWPAMLKKTWESLGQQGDQTLNPKGNQPWIFIGRTDAEAEDPLLWSPDAKSQLNRKDLDPAKDWGKKRRERQRMMRWLDDSMDMSLSKLQEVVKDREVQGVAKSQTRISNWITITKVLFTQLQQLSTPSHSHSVQTPSYFLVQISLTGDYFEAIPTIIPLQYNYFIKLQFLNLKNTQ